MDGHEGRQCMVWYSEVIRAAARRSRELKRRLGRSKSGLDFTERLLAKDRDPQRLAGPR